MIHRTLGAAAVGAIVLLALTVGLSPAEASSAPAVTLKCTPTRDATCFFTATDDLSTSLTYEFWWGDGTPSVKGSVASGGRVDLEHTYAKDGFYYVWVDVKDGDGKVGQRAVQIDAQPPIPLVFAPVDGKVYRSCTATNDSPWNTDPPRAMMRGCLWISFYDHEAPAKLSAATVFIPNACPGQDVLVFGESASPLTIKVTYDVCTTGDGPITVYATDYNGNTAEWTKTVRHYQGTCAVACV
jgi:hypothetical protein